MTILEKKVDALIRLCLTDDPHQQERCKQELRDLIAGGGKAGTIREEASALLTKIGVPAHLMGYRYVLEAICIAAEDANAARHGNVSSLWETVANICGTTPKRVDRCVRNSVERCFEHGDQEIIEHYFGGTVSRIHGKLTCGEFVSECGRIVRDKLNGGTA